MSTYFFIRRYVMLDSAERTFTISKDELLEIEGVNYEVALAMTTRSLTTDTLKI